MVSAHTQNKATNLCTGRLWLLGHYDFTLLLDRLQFLHSLCVNWFSTCRFVLACHGQSLLQTPSPGSVVWFVDDHLVVGAPTLLTQVPPLLVLTDN